MQLVLRDMVRSAQRVLAKRKKNEKNTARHTHGIHSSFPSQCHHWV
jgi:hypothetical protein